MLKTTVVIDSVVHAFDLRPENAKAGRYAEMAFESFFHFGWEMMEEPYRLTREQYFHQWNAEELASCLFVESPTDIAVYHPIPTWGIFEDLSPASVGIEMRARYPGRVLLYGAVSPLDGGKALAELEQQAEEWDIIGLKLYPVDIIDEKMQSWTMNDEKVAYPVFSKCLELGIGTVAVHKALPLATAPMDPFRPGDVDYAAADFPDLNFEIVHGGAAFLDETALQLGRFPNVYVNLEATSQLLVKHPKVFAKIMGEFLLGGGKERLVWGTGAMSFHPGPILKAFEEFQMPEGFTYPELTDETKAAILCGNYARMHGLDVAALANSIQNDELAQQRSAGNIQPWQGLTQLSSSR